MIFVTLGTQDKQFTRLIKAVEKLVIDGSIKDEIIVQAGHTKYTSDKIKILNYIPFNEFNDYLNKADIIITHGGVGSILSSIKLKKKVIAVARLKKYNEHVNDHQLQVIEKMEKQGYIIGCYDESDLNNLYNKINEVKTLEPKEYKSNSENFLKKFNDILNELLESS